MTAPRRLPGLRIEATPPPAAEVLPRMDVAVLVGFAATGPLHRPVVVESVADYAAVFGADAPLAWDTARGELALAHLGAAVRAFFANGGRRCWVIRVARTQALVDARRALGLPASTDAVATSNRFALPGLLEATASGIRPALAQARCEGSWSDGLRVSTAAGARAIAVNAIDADPAAADRAIVLVDSALEPGAVLGLGEQLTAFAVVLAARPLSAPQRGVALDVRLCGVFEPLAPDPVAPTALPGSVAIAGRDEVMDGDLEAPTDIASAASELDAPGAAQGTATNSARITLRASPAASPDPGHWLRWSDCSAAVWLHATTVGITGGSPSPAGSPPDADGTGARRVTVLGPAWRELPLAWTSDLLGATRARVHDLTLRVRGDDASRTIRGTARANTRSGGRDEGSPDRNQREARLHGVGLAPAHPRGWWRQLPDALVFGDTDAPSGQAAMTGNGRPAMSERFPLARIDAEGDGGAPVAWLPLAVGPLFGPAVGPCPQAATALERDGLAQFDASLFLDPELAEASVGALLTHADDIRFMRHRPRALFGVHAALAIGGGDEATLIAVPDAVHLGWQRRANEPVPSVPPAKVATPPHWSTHRGPCVTARDAVREPPQGHKPCCTDGAATSAATGGMTDGCAASGASASAGGNARGGKTAASAPLDHPDFGRFLDCATRALPAPQLFAPPSPVAPGAFRLHWTASEPGVLYVVQEASRADFSDAREVYRGAGLATLRQVDGDALLHYRVQAVLGDEASLPSGIVSVRVQAAAWVLRDPAAWSADADAEAETTLPAIQRAVLRLAAASGHLFAVLALPRHFRVPQACRYARQLRAVQAALGPADPGALRFDEARALSYGALYFPWLQSDARLGPALPLAQRKLRVVPPDGVALGVLAARASQRGAWIAAANEPLKDVVAIVPEVAPADRQALQDAQINLLRADPRGFFALSADTLALDADVDVRPINVRRLLTLLRRLALRRGARYVFEPNGPTLRRAVQRGFELTLGELFERGAFAGATAAQSFRVVTDDTINTPREADAGRLLVELRVAPALPMRFIGLRLTQAGERLAVVEAL